MTAKGPQNNAWFIEMRADVPMDRGNVMTSAFGPKVPRSCLIPESVAGQDRKFFVHCAVSQAEVHARH